MAAAVAVMMVMVVEVAIVLVVAHHFSEPHVSALSVL